MFPENHRSGIRPEMNASTKKEWQQLRLKRKVVREQFKLTFPASNESLHLPFFERCGCHLLSSLSKQWNQLIPLSYSCYKKGGNLLSKLINRQCFGALFPAVGRSLDTCRISQARSIYLPMVAFLLSLSHKET